MLLLKLQTRQLIFFFIAGNDAQNDSNLSPGCVNGNYIYTISTMDNLDQLTSWSNYGNPPVDYAAPGLNMYSTYKNGGYATMHEASMSAPHATGVFLVTS